MRRPAALAAAVVALALALAGCTGSTPHRPDPVVAVAGDISTSGQRDASAATAHLIEKLHPAAVLTVGDNQYNTGASAAFTKFFATTWGAFKAIIHPSPGHHEYYTDPTAAGYYGYFGAAANNSSQPHCTSGCEGYYSFDIGSWHLIALNTNHYRPGTSPRDICAYVACDAGSAQVRWLRHDLATNTRHCVLAYWSDPRWSSGTRHGSNPALGPIWDALYAAHADVVVNGHEHLYERFAQQDPQGRPDPKGIREFTAGTGGNSLYPFGTPLPTSQARDNHDHGILELTLHRDSYSWRFVAVGGRTVDSGSTQCHG